MKENKKEKQFGQKTVKFYYKNPTTHTEQVLWYISHLHKKVWNHMQDICSGKFDHIDILLDKVNIKGQEEIQKLKDSLLEVVTREGSTYNKSKSLSEFGMLYCLGPIRNSDPELLQLPLNDLQKPCRVLAKSWKSFYELSKRGDKAARPPRYKGESFFFTLQWEKPKIISIGGKCNLVVNHKISGVGEILIPLPKYVCELVSDKKVRFVTIKRTHTHVDHASDFEINLVYETELVEKISLSNDTKIAGIDVGSRRITVVVSDEPSKVKTYELRAHDKYFTKQRQKIEQKMKLCKKGSKRYRKLADTITKLSNKWHNCQKDSQRKIAADIIKKADVFYIGETNIRVNRKDKEGNVSDSLAQSKDGSKSEHRAVQNTGNLSRMTQFINEKAVEYGKYTSKVPDHKSDTKNKKDSIKIIGAVCNMEYGIANRP